MSATITERLHHFQFFIEYLKKLVGFLTVIQKIYKPLSERSRIIWIDFFECSSNRIHGDSISLDAEMLFGSRTKKIILPIREVKCHVLTSLSQEIFIDNASYF